MADTTLEDAIEDEYETELSRLGSSKALYALTEGEMDTGPVLAELASRASTAAETFAGWTDDPAHGELFEEAAELVQAHADRIADAAGDTGSAGVSEQVDEVLEMQADPDARLGALLAWLLVTDRTLAQAVGFFVGNADPSSADLFRELRSEVDDLRAATLDRTDDADRDVALAAANQVVEGAYDQYVATLEGLGVKVKPVC